MEFVCTTMPAWACESLLGLPFLRLTKEETVAFIFGSLIVTFFAIDHYKIPTYAKTTIGEFIELAPESLTSTSRYRKGLLIYISLIFGLYLAFCFFWSQELMTILSGFGLEIDKSALWPLAAATAVTLVGTGGDKNPLSRLEASLRSIAHEAAYIPEAVLDLSTDLNGTFTINEEMSAQLGETKPELLEQIRQSQDGSFQTWIRAKYLFSRLDLLRQDTEFKQLLDRPENIRAVNFLSEEERTLADRVAQRLEENHSDLDEALKKKVEDFRNAVSVFLASVLWQGSASDSAISQKLIRLRLNIDPANRAFSWDFVARVLSSLGAATVVTYLLLHLFNWQFHGLTSDFWQLTLAFLVFVMASLFVTKRREARLVEGKTDKLLDASIRAVVFCGLPIGLVAAIATFVIYQGGQARFWAILWTGISLAALSAFFFEVVMRWAAESPSTDRASPQFEPTGARQPELWQMVGKAVLLYAGIGFIAAFLMFWVGQVFIVSGAPTEVADAANGFLTSVIEGFPKRVDDAKSEESDPFAGLTVAHFSALQNAVKDSQVKVARAEVTDDTIKGITSKCDAVNQAAGNKLYTKECTLNVGFTRDLPESAWNEAFKAASAQTDSLVANLRQMLRYSTLTGAIAVDWQRAVYVSAIWAWMAAVFSASIFLYRRTVLWEGINSQSLSEYRAQGGADAEKWLRTPLLELSDITPLEAIRYHDLRATLSDYLKTNKPQSKLPSLRAVA